MLAKTRLEMCQIQKMMHCIREKDNVDVDKSVDYGVRRLINYINPLNGDTPLVLAAVRNDVDMLNRLLKMDALPDVPDIEGRTALMRAADQGHVESVFTLVNAGTDLNLVDNMGKGVLYYCIAPTERHTLCMEAILKVDDSACNNVTKEGEPLLVHACGNDNKDLCLMLLDHGANPSLAHRLTNRTALMAASRVGNSAVIRRVLAFGVNVNATMVQPEYAVRQGRPDLEAARTGTHAVHEAAKGGHLIALQILSGNGAEFNQIDSDGMTPIHFAAMGGFTAVCLFLATRGCDAAVKTKRGLQAQQLAVTADHPDTAKVCRKAIKVFKKLAPRRWMLKLYDFCSEHQEPLLKAFRAVDVEELGGLKRDDFTQVLVQGFAPLPEDISKMTPLYEKYTRDRGLIDYTAFLTGTKYIEKKLRLVPETTARERGKGASWSKGKPQPIVDVCVLNNQTFTPGGLPPSHMVRRHIYYTDRRRFGAGPPPPDRHPYKDDSAWYLPKNPVVYTPLTDATRHGDRPTIDDTVMERPPGAADTIDPLYKTPLMIACAQGNLELAKYLVENGANVNATDNFRWTPLHFATFNAQPAVVEWLLSKGAKREAASMAGTTPLLRAVQTSRPKLVKIFTDRGCQLSAENMQGVGVLDMAQEFGDFRVYNVIFDKLESFPLDPKKKKKK